MGAEAEMVIDRKCEVKSVILVAVVVRPRRRRSRLAVDVVVVFLVAAVFVRCYG